MKAAPVDRRDDRGLRQDEAACAAARVAPFYAEAPLRFPRGQAAGALGVAATEARVLTPDKRNILEQVRLRLHSYV